MPHEVLSKYLTIRQPQMNSTISNSIIHFIIYQTLCSVYFMLYNMAITHVHLKKVQFKLLIANLLRTNGFLL